MSLDPRSRLSVGIDGRQYARKTSLYVDVLGLSTITEAVQEASRMLRRGIVRAMSSSNVDDPTIITKQEKPQKSQSSQRLTSQQFQPAQSAQRDLVSVYSSAITKKERKPISDNANATTKSTANDIADKDSPTVDLTRPSTSNLRTWNSSKKAGPSILSKRNRSASSTVGADRVFQPAPKRERHTESPAKLAASAAPSRGSSSERESDPKHLSSTRNVKGSVHVPRAEGIPDVKARSAALPPQPPPASSSSSSSPSPSTSPPPPPLPHPPPLPPPSLLHAQNDLATVAKAKKPLKGTTSKSASLLSQPMRSRALLGTARGSGLPASWSQVPGKSSKPSLSLQSTANAASSLTKKSVPVSGTAIGGQRPSAAQKRPLSGAAVSPLQAKVKKSSIVPILPRPSPAASGGASEGIIPTPSTTGIQVKYVPGSTTINGVRPNGYTVSNEGVVKPVVSFNPKPKLPHKLRQTSVEKLFEGWRDVKKIAEAEALSLALRTEQEMYADATGRIDYRAAMTVKLKEIKQ